MITANYNPQPRERPSSRPNQLRSVDSIRYGSGIRWSAPPDFAYDDTAYAKLDKLDGVLARSFTSRDDAALIGEMLSLPNDGRYPTIELSPQERRQKTFSALTAQIEMLSQCNPVLMIFEDVHWAYLLAWRHSVER